MQPPGEFSPFIEKKVVRRVTPPPSPLSGPTTKKTTFFMCVYPKGGRKNKHEVLRDMSDRVEKKKKKKNEFSNCHENFHLVFCKILRNSYHEIFVKIFIYFIIAQSFSKIKKTIKYWYFWINYLFLFSDTTLLIGSHKAADLCWLPVKSTAKCTMSVSISWSRWSQGRITRNSHKQIVLLYLGWGNLLEYCECYVHSAT